MWLPVALGCRYLWAPTRDAPTRTVPDTPCGCPLLLVAGISGHPLGVPLHGLCRTRLVAARCSWLPVSLGHPLGMPPTRTVPDTPGRCPLLLVAGVSAHPIGGPDTDCAGHACRGLRRTGDQRIAQVQREPCMLGLRAELGCQLRTRPVEGQDAVVVFGRQVQQAHLQVGATLSLWQAPHAVFQLMDHDRRQPKVLMLGKRRNDAWVRVAADNLRDHLGIEEIAANPPPGSPGPAPRGSR